MRRHFRGMAASVAAILTTSVAGLWAQAAEPESSTMHSSTRPKMVLVELFTSEGCSSCPPADTLLRQIDGTRTSAGQLIVGISEHVTYWNSLGWSDPFSSPIYTDRQNAYGTRFNLNSVYTPQMVINGEHQIVGSDRAALMHALQTEQGASQVALRILAAAVEGEALTVRFSAVGDGSAREPDILAVLADNTDHSSVLRGENSGNSLSHVAVARSLLRVAKLQSVAEQTVKIQLPPSFHASHGHHLILFAQTPGSGRVLGVDTMPF